MQKRRVFINAIMSLIQTIIVSGIMFFLYKFLLKTIGVKQLGIWSLVLATTSVTQVANLGFSGSVVKFVAKYIARDENENVAGVIQTAIISIGVLIGFILLLGYPLIKWILGLVIPINSLAYAINILPYALLSLWLTMLTNIVQSGIDGFQMIYKRNILMICCSIFYAFLCFVFTPKNGLIGLAYAQIINNFLILTVSWILIKRLLPALPIIPYQWKGNLFKDIISYGISFQAISITQMLYDPTTKALLSKFGGLSMVGYYEMANRMVQQFRSLIVSANQVLVPSISDLHERNPVKISAVYQTNYNLLFYIAVPLYTLIIISAHFISGIWIGHYEKVFVIFGILLATGSFFNILNVPSYYSNLGIGDLRWNVMSHIVIAVFNVLLGILMGFLFYGYGVVIAWVIALSFGSAIIYISYHLTYKIPLNKLFPKDSRIMFLLCSILLLLYLLINLILTNINKTIIFNIIIVFLSALILLIPLWFHPMRKQIFVWIDNEFYIKK